MSADNRNFDSINVLSLVDEAQRQIRKRIVAGDFAPGAPLRDSVLASQMGISRSPVREALRMLEQAGLVRKAANRSYRISELAATDIPELASLRVADEIIAVRSIVKNRTNVESLDKAIDRFRDAEATPSEIAEADREFHSAVVDLAGMPRLSNRYAELSDQIRLALIAADFNHDLVSPIALDRHVSLRTALQAAVRTGEPEAVVRIWEEHILRGMRVPDLFR
ncbi:GntR family transcriptional regulator [Rhodococcus sp. 1R11]|uniref:GntR family transcriptional regulator n=1 Tax=Rhodococcus sp. 1R11 TaxID=2559614 RepID=UPI0010729B38|nr:GntR family transcriptional regulator [Rhodococcus sp. 1R11]TFI42495.1 GntR family transcriptional regulator [Rhodococcus sp. 1R11]